MHYLGLGRADAQTNWSDNRKKKTIPQLTDRLIEIIKMFKNVPVPDDLNTSMYPPPAADFFVALSCLGRPGLEHS